MAPTGLPCRNTTRAARAGWVALLVLGLLLKAAVPWLAADAARARGVSTADVCSVYGVRTLAASPAGTDGSAPASHAHKACPLATLLAAVPLPALPPRLAMSPGRAPADATAVPAGTMARDPVRRWLTQRLHAPPVA